MDPDATPRDPNYIPVLVGVSSETITIDGVIYIQDETPVSIAVNPATGAVIVEVV